VISLLRLLGRQQLSPISLGGTYLPHGHGSPAEDVRAKESSDKNGYNDIPIKIPASISTLSFKDEGSASHGEQHGDVGNRELTNVQKRSQALLPARRQESPWATTRVNNDTLFNAILITQSIALSVG
jgi:hypothetical protein